MVTEGYHNRARRRVARARSLDGRRTEQTEPTLRDLHACAPLRLQPDEVVVPLGELVSHKNHTPLQLGDRDPKFLGDFSLFLPGGNRAHDPLEFFLADRRTGHACVSTMLENVLDLS